MIAAFLALFLFASPEEESSQHGLQRCVPAGVPIFVGVDDLGELREGFASTSLARFLGSRHMDGARLALGQAFGGIAADRGGAAGPALALLGLVSGGACACLLDVGGPKEPAGPVTVALALLAEVGTENEDAARDQVERLMQPEVEAGEVDRQVEERALGECVVFRIKRAEPSPAGDADPAAATDPVEVRYAISNGVLVAVAAHASLDGGAHVDRLLSGVHGELPQSLGQARAFASSGAGDPDIQLRLFADVGAFLARALEGPLERGEITRDDLDRVSRLGLFDVTRVAFGIGFHPDGTRARLDLNWSGQGWIPRVIRKAVGRGELRTLGYMPAEPRSAIAVRVDLRAGLREALAMVRDVMPVGGEERAAMIEGMLHQGDLDIERDVLGNVDGEIGAYVAALEDDLEALPGSEDDPIGVAVLVPLRDGRALASLVETLLDESGMDAARLLVPIGRREASKLPLPGVGSIYFAILDDLLVLSNARELMRDALGRVDREGGASLAANPLVSGAIREIADGSPSLVSVGDAAAAAADLLRGLRAAVDASPLAGFVELPDPAVAREFFQGTAVRVAVVGEDGVRLQSRSP